MKKNEVKIGGVHVAKVSDKLVDVRIENENRQGGWDATNLTTKKKVRIKSAQRLRAPARAAGTSKPKSKKAGDASAGDTASAKGKASTGTKQKRVSALDAAAQILREAGKPMRCTELIEVMADQGLWTSPNGKTPHATLYAAILREINKAVEKATVSRFRKVDRGLFTFNTTVES